MRIDAAYESWRASVRDVVESFGASYFRDRYREREYPREFYDALVSEGWPGLLVPERYGGADRSFVEATVMLEELAAYGYDFAMPALLTLTGARTVAERGTETQRERFLPGVLAGDARFSIGITEPHSGSDAAGLSTTARRDGDAYVVDGTKTYQSGADAPGNHIAAYVREPGTERKNGISLLLVPVDADGVTCERLPFVARKAVGTNRVTFDGVRVPVENRIGAEGDGWSVLTDHLVVEHAFMAAAMVGNAKEAVEAAIRETESRERFGRRVADFQAVEHRLADLHTEVEAARGLVYRAAAALDDGDATRKDAARAKLKAGETLKETSAEVMQLFGGASLDPDNDVERYWREGVSATIAGGTSEIQRSVLANALLDSED